MDALPVASPAPARIRMVAKPSSVPVARRFVNDTLVAWGHLALVEDACLCVTELSTNATVHSGSRFFEVEVRQLRRAVRIGVLDTGPMPPHVVTASPEADGRRVDAPVLSAGRGLLIVSALSSLWGVEKTPDGKQVWAELTWGR